LRLKCTKFDFGWGSAPQTPLGELTALPKPPSWILRGLTSKGGEGREGDERVGERGDWEGKGEMGRERAGKGGGRGREGTP